MTVKILLPVYGLLARGTGDNPDAWLLDSTGVAVHSISRRVLEVSLEAWRKTAPGGFTETEIAELDMLEIPVDIRDLPPILNSPESN